MNKAAFASQEGRGRIGMEKVSIYLLGRFEIRYGSQRIEGQLSKSRKGLLMLQYLLLRRGEDVPYQELYDVLWHQEESANPENALKTMVSRLRVSLSQCAPGLERCIATARGAYRWEMAEECTVDLFEFEKLCQALEKAETLDEESRPLFARAIGLYTGNLLPDEKEQEAFISARSVEVQNEYLSLVHRYLSLLAMENDQEEIIRVCRLALETDAFDERLNLMLMNALVHANRNNDAVMQYKHVSNLHQQYLGERPPEGIREFYRKIILAGKGLDSELEAIQTELSEYHQGKGPLICKYAVFKEIYNLQLRALERSEAVICLGLMMITGADGAEMDPLQLDEAMRVLLNVLTNGLRRGDAVAHYTASQYALLLPVRGADDGTLVMERLKNQFNRQYANSTALLHYRIAPIACKARLGDRKK